MSGLISGCCDIASIDSTSGTKLTVELNLSPFEQLAFSTIRIECDLASGGKSTGTGFFFKFADQGQKFVPAIVTNKHVVNGSTNGRLHFTVAKLDGQPDVGNRFLWHVKGFEHAWLHHPDPNVDLCIMPISSLITQAALQGKNFFVIYFDWSLLPSEPEIEDFVGLEKIVMVGYPNGIWDERHNFPVFRSGVLATHYRYDWNGRPEFLIDCACFPGSSGSPVLICDVGQVHTRKGLQIGESRLKFLGVLYAGPQHTVDGKVEIVPVPTSSQIVSRSSIPNNLGMVIKSRMLRQFDDLVSQEKAQTESKPADP